MVISVYMTGGVCREQSFAKAGKIKPPNGPGNSEAGLENKLKWHL